MIVVIDFGMIYLGYCFLFCYDFENDFFKVLVNIWMVGMVGFVFFKIFIIVLLDSNQELVVFGYEVEDCYVELVDEEEYVEYYYFW